MKTVDFYDTIITKQTDILRAARARLDSAIADGSMDRTGSAGQSGISRMRCRELQRGADEEFKVLVSLMAARDSAGQQRGAAHLAGQPGKEVSRDRLKRALQQARELMNDNQARSIDRMETMSLDIGPQTAHALTVPDPMISIVAAVTIALNRLSAAADAAKVVEDMRRVLRSRDATRRESPDRTAGSDRDG